MVSLQYSIYHLDDIYMDLHEKFWVLNIDHKSVNKRSWLENNNERTQKYISDILNSQSPPWGDFLKEKKVEQQDAAFEKKTPWSMKKIWNSIYQISNSLQTWEFIPAAFGVDWIMVRQRIDIWLYLSVMQESKKYLREQEDRFVKNYWVAMNGHQRCQAAMHSISHHIAKLMRPHQHDAQYKSYVDKIVASGSTILDPNKIKQLELENCLIKSAIAHQFLHSIWFTSSRFLLSEKKEHAYVEIDVWQWELRLDVNSPIHIPFKTNMWKKEIFYKARISGDGIKKDTLSEQGGIL